MPAGQQQRRLQLVSFENDLDSLHLALRHTQWFKHLRHAAPNALLAVNRWESAAGDIEWLLLPGDFVQRKHDAPAPDIVFFDPFSFKTDSGLVDAAGVSRTGAAVPAQGHGSIYLHLFHQGARCATGRRLLRGCGSRHRSQA